MALQSSGQINISDIQAELGSSSGSLRTLSAAAGFSAPDAMSEFYGYSSLTPSDNFIPVTYTGNSGQQTISTGFQPDFVWIKGRSGYSHALFDVVRGAGKNLPISVSLEGSSTQSLQSFNSTSFDLGVDSDVNYTGAGYVAWCWKGGNGTSANTNGSVTSTVSVNDAAGFSVVGWTTIAQNATAYTVGHGLSAAPDLIIIKDRQTFGVGVHVYSSAFPNPQKEYLQLNLGDALYTNNTNIWNNTAATSSVWSMKSGYAMAAGANCIAYCFRNISGYQKIGSYTGNGVASLSNPLINTGFQPRFVMIKNIDYVQYPAWFIFDSARNPTNPVNKYLVANSSGGEGAGGVSTDYIRFESTGFRSTSDAPGLNQNNIKYLYLAIA